MRQELKYKTHSSSMSPITVWKSQNHLPVLTKKILGYEKALLHVTHDLTLFLWDLYAIFLESRNTARGDGEIKDSVV